MTIPNTTSLDWSNHLTSPMFQWSRYKVPVINGVAFPKFNMEPENDDFQVRNLLFQGAIFRFHVKLWEGITSISRIGLWPQLLGGEEMDSITKMGCRRQKELQKEIDNHTPPTHESPRVDQQGMPKYENWTPAVKYGVVAPIAPDMEWNSSIPRRTKIISDSSTSGALEVHLRLQTPGGNWKEVQIWTSGFWPSSPTSRCVHRRQWIE